MVEVGWRIRFWKMSRLRYQQARVFEGELICMLTSSTMRAGVGEESKVVSHVLNSLRKEGE